MVEGHVPQGVGVQVPLSASVKETSVLVDTEVFIYITFINLSEKFYFDSKRHISFVYPIFEKIYNLEKDLLQQSRLIHNRN